MNIEAIEKQRTELSPIWYASFEYKILKSLKTLKKSYTHYKSCKIVCKGTREEMLKGHDIKIRVLKTHFQRDNNGNKKAVLKKVSDFDLNRITLTAIKISHFKGYGIKRK